MALYDQFQWAPGMGMEAVSDNTARQAQATQAFAAANETNVDTAKKTAELEEFMSQTAKDLRETEREAKLGQFKDDIANNESLQKYYRDNPNFRDERAAAKAHGDMLKIQKETSEDEHTIERAETATYYDPKTGEINLDNYGKSRDRLIQLGVHTEDDSPTVEEMRTNPKAMDAVKRAATYSYMTQEQKVAQMTAAQLAADRRKEQSQQDAASMARTQAEITARATEAEKDRTSRKDIANIQATARGASDRARIEGIKLKSTLGAAAKAGKVLPLSQVGGDIKSLVATGIAIMDEMPEAQNLSDEQKRAAAALAGSNSQQQYFGNPLNAPSWYMRRNIEDYLADPRTHQEGSTFVGVPLGDNFNPSEATNAPENMAPATTAPEATTAPATTAPAATTQEAPQGTKKISQLSPAIQQAYEALGNSPAGLKKKEDFRKQYSVIEG